MIKYTINPENVRIMVIDDEIVTVRRLVQTLKKDGFQVEGFTDASTGLHNASISQPNIIILDIHLKDASGLDLMQKIHSMNPDIAVILITGYASIENAVDATKKGAFHYLAKPFKLDNLRDVIQKAINEVEEGRQQRNIENKINKSSRFGEIIGVSPPMRSVFKKISQVAPVDCNVVIQGESGTGKELVARSLHVLSPRAKTPFVPFNCGAFSEDLVANELFGHEKGAFTGAVTTKIGLLESANGGTVLLDEVTEMPLSMQVKLLRVIQERNFMRVGGVQPITLNVRFVAATNRDIDKMINAREFRQDLYYRLKVVLITLPPLRERLEDIPYLCRHFVKKIALHFGREVPEIAPDFLDILSNYSFPGNVRELEHMVEHAMALSGGSILKAGDLPSDILVGAPNPVVSSGQKTSLKSLEKDHISEVYSRTGYNQTETAQILGISRTTLWRRLKESGLLKQKNRP